jgi:hypothetical protein
MGLSIAIFDLAEYLADEEVEPEEIEDVKADFAQLDIFLRARGFPGHVEPEEIPAQVDYRGEIVGFPYSCLHFLRRAYLYLRLGIPFTAYVGDWATQDPELAAEYERPRIDSHLIHFSDSTGFYVPIDFAKPLVARREDEVRGDAVGSSQGLLRELIEVAPLINILLIDGELSEQMAAELADFDMLDHQPFATERMVWFTLYEAARKSIAFGTAIRFG